MGSEPPALAIAESVLNLLIPVLTVKGMARVGAWRAVRKALGLTKELVIDSGSRPRMARHDEVRQGHVPPFYRCGN